MTTTQETPNQTQAPPVEEAAPSRVATIIGHAKKAAGWSAPVVHDALKQETGADLYDFVGAEQPELTRSQQFASGVTQFALRRAAERMAERSARAA